MRLVDRFGREIRSLRFSLTRRCNLKCIYCHHEGEISPQRKRVENADVCGDVNAGSGKEISADLVVKIAKVASQRFHVRKVKFSGGEPLLRRDICEIIQRIREHEDEISLTTNGTLLSRFADELADAGLDRVNVSLDTLNSEKYDAITRTKGNMKKVIEGIHSALIADLTPLKINMVVLPLNRDDIDEMMNFVRALNAEYGDGSAILQLIELIPDFCEYNEYDYRTKWRGEVENESEDEIKDESVSGKASVKASVKAGGNAVVDFEEIERMLRLKAKAIATRPLQHRRKYFLEGLVVEVVKPMDNSAFCMHCKRLRITSDAKIKPCLLRNDNLVYIGGDDVDEDHIAERLLYSMRFREPFYKG